jgi:L-ribulose-5-phosphate 4-epimerase
VGFTPELEVAIARARAELTRSHHDLVRRGLISSDEAHVSVRVPGADLLVITSPELHYDDIAPESLVICDLDGVVVADALGSELAPAREVAAHAHVYRSLDEVGAIVHTHSPYAVAWAAAGEPLPAVLTTSARRFGGEVPVGPLVVSDEEDLGRGLVETLLGSRSPAVLMAGHGPFTVGPDARSAVDTALQLEEAAQSTYLARQLGSPAPLGQSAIDALRSERLDGRTTREVLA